MSQIFFGSFIAGKKCSEKSRSVPIENDESSDYGGGVILDATQEINPSRILTITGLQSFNSNQEAIESGLGEGVVYRSGDQLCIVHLE